MEQSQYNFLFSFIWNIANDVLVNAFNKGDYKKVILPMLVLRRIDVLLEPTKDAVIQMKEQLDKNKIENQAPVLYDITGYPFYNTSKFTMKTLKSEIDPLRLKMNFIEYLNGYSKDVLDIIEKLHLRQVVDNLTEAERLGSIIEKFTSDKINLSSKPVYDGEGKILHPALDNHTVGMMFEELLRRFNEENNVTEAGEHFTPRDYVKLLADLAVLPVADKIKATTYSVYDGACGTGGILTIAQERIKQIGKEQGKDVAINIYGQELLSDTYATCKADLMISGHIKSFQYNYAGEEREYIAFDSTVSRDGHAGETYDFCISNPPFGTPWKEDLKKRGLKETEKAKFTDSRFNIAIGNGENRKEITFLPDIGDCQMLFLANNLSRMVDDTEMGTRIVEVHNGSSLFTGNAGSGASNLRQYIIENDMLEAIIAMPENDFYNTGIGTYIWIVTNRKEERRKGYVQLIDATDIKSPLRKNLGKKNCETNEADRNEIVKMLLDFKETKKSKIFPNKEFGYYSVTVERPLRLVYENLDEIALPDLKNKGDGELLQRVVEAWEKNLGGHTVGDFALFLMLEQMKVKVPASKVKLVRQYLGKHNDKADVCFAKPTKRDSAVVTDPSLRDTEQVPLLYPGGIDAFMEKEVLPYAPDAFYDAANVVVGYELSFTKYFYKPVELRTIADITTDINGIEGRLKGVLKDILNV
ncbi:type I restriction-modification system subunit M [Leyella stercorea]|uniref:type I restriction-modification system subunit M n=1 Tax=Leyella stercorea TaxID=363265 RepID=UPI003AF89CB7